MSSGITSYIMKIYIERLSLTLHKIKLIVFLIRNNQNKINASSHEVN